METELLNQFNSFWNFIISDDRNEPIYGKFKGNYPELLKWIEKNFIRKNKFIIFNINDHIKFKFINNGKELWEKFYLDLGIEPKFPRMEDDYYIDQAWNVFEKLGKYFSIGMNPPIEPVIYIETIHNS